jgi:uncharacterized protein YcbK (DUF882 family)
LTALVLFLGCSSLQNAAANGDTRTLSFRHTHTNEEITVTYKRDGRYDDDALKKINWIMRDWRRDEAIRMDLQVIDAVWELYRDVGATRPIEIICGYRAPATNEMLRRRSGGVARFSQHTLGRAIDLHIPGVSLEAQREAAMRLQRGGVGYYPSSTFIHVDVASIRHWPRMTYAQLSRVFPNGRTVHVASNGKALPGYQLALTDVSRRGRAPSQTSLDAARVAGVDVDVATPKRQPNLLASLFGAAKDAEEEEDATRSTSAPAPAAPARAVAKVAAVSPPKPEPKAETRRAGTAAVVQIEKPVQTASADGFVPTPRRLPGRAAVEDEPNASGTPWPLREDEQKDRVPLELALAYAAEPNQVRGPVLARVAALASVPDPAPAGSDDAPVASVKKMSARVTLGSERVAPNPTIRTAMPVTAGMRFDDPWLRAAMFAPSLYTSLTTSFSGERDFSELASLMSKPVTAVKMTFSDDPHQGLECERFSGEAVVFISTVTFRRTASLRF